MKRTLTRWVSCEELVADIDATVTSTVENFQVRALQKYKATVFGPGSVLKELKVITVGFPAITMHR